MNPGNPELSALFVLNPVQAVAQVVEAIDRANGDLKRAAGILKVGRTSLYRWMREYPQIEISVQRIRGELQDE